jgi:hypothetical protein
MDFSPGTTDLYVTYFEQNSLTPSGVGMTTMEYTDPVNGTCGSSDGGTFSSTPSSGLCNAGVAGTVSGSGPWTWYCAGVGGTTASCSANHTPINGTCGTAAQNYPSAATDFSGSFCSSGTANPSNPAFPSVGASIPWVCEGFYAGANANCSATHQASACAVSSLAYGESVSGFIAVSGNDCDSSPFSSLNPGIRSQKVVITGSAGDIISLNGPLESATALWGLYDSEGSRLRSGVIVTDGCIDDRVVLPSDGAYDLWFASYFDTTYTVSLEKLQTCQTLWRDDFDDDSTSEYVGDYYGWGNPFNTANESGGTIKLADPIPGGGGTDKWVDFWFDTGQPDGYFPANSVVTARIRINSNRTKGMYDDYMFNDDW